MEAVSNEDRYAVLEEKLKIAESALYGCRAILNHVRRLETAPVEQDELYPGQLPEQEECVE